MTVTIVDIAREVHMTHGTVSRALRGSQQVSRETRKLIQQTARKMGYMPNSLARSLRTRSSNTIGIILPSDVQMEVLQERVAATARLAHQENLDLMTYYNWPEEHPYQRAVHSLRSAQVAGLIVSHMCEPTLPEALKDWVDEDRPIIFLTDYGRESFNMIDTDRVEGFRLATEYLVGLGHRKLSIVLPWWDGPTPSPNVQVRLEGFRKGLQEAGLPYSPERVITYKAMIEEGMTEAMRRLVDSPDRPTALLTYNDNAAAACIQELAKLGLKVPKDISVVGFNDSSISRRNLIPITTLAQPVEEMARITMRKLTDMVRGEGAKRFPSVLCPPKLMIRETTAGLGP
ncbi:MAG: LacI family DNA-binding transcriptional regulator [Phycisphaerae bacterium]|nr:LacI family DNA-binding transcriptional regulator [Phycisphaerae bacterium]